MRVAEGLHLCVGDCDEESLPDCNTFDIVNATTANAILTVLLAFLDKSLDDVEWCLEKTRLGGSSNSV